MTYSVLSTSENLFKEHFDLASNGPYLKVVILDTLAVECSDRGPCWNYRQESLAGTLELELIRYRPGLDEELEPKLLSA